jgi:hypothetical protein
MIDFAILGVIGALYVLNIVNFAHNPTDFGPFLYSFKPQLISIFRYNFYFIAIVSTVFLLYFIPQQTWVSMIPFSMFLMYLIIKRPHKEHFNNFRAILNTLVVLSCFGIRVFNQYNDNESEINLLKANFLYTMNVMFLLIVAIVALCSVAISKLNSDKITINNYLK